MACKAAERQLQREKELFITIGGAELLSSSLVYYLNVPIMPDIKITFYLLANNNVIPQFSLT